LVVDWVGLWAVELVACLVELLVVASAVDWVALWVAVWVECWVGMLAVDWVAL